jgi:C4-dicarboxylate-specific signal transduction histidine kinase
MLTEEAQAFFTTRNGGKVSGLGLSFVARVVEDCGGRLEIESEPEVGTTMSMVLPGRWCCRVDGVAGSMVLPAASER